MNKLKRYAEFIKESAEYDNLDDNFWSYIKRYLEQWLDFELEDNYIASGDEVINNVDDLVEFYKRCYYMLDTYAEVEWNEDELEEQYGFSAYDMPKIVLKFADTKVRELLQEIWDEGFKDKVKDFEVDPDREFEWKEGSSSKKLTGDELYAHILNEYVGDVEDELNMEDFSDEFEYYDNVIYRAVSLYMELEDEDADEDELTDGLKNYWQPI